MSDETKNTDGQKTGDGDQKSKVEFSPEQQAHIDALIGKKYAEAHTKAEGKWNEKVSTLEKQLNELQGKGEGKEKKDKGEDLTALKDRLAAMEEREKKSQERERRAEILTIAAELNAVSGNQVAMLVTPHLRETENGKLAVVNAEGQVRYNSNGQPMTVKEFVGEFLNGNPHLVKASGATGAGSQGARFGADSAGKPLTVDSIRNMPIEDLKKEMAKGIVIPGSAGQEFRFKDNKNAFAKTS